MSTKCCVIFVDLGSFSQQKTSKYITFKAKWEDLSIISLFKASCSMCFCLKLLNSDSDECPLLVLKNDTFWTEKHETIHLNSKIIHRFSYFALKIIYFDNFQCKQQQNTNLIWGYVCFVFHNSPLRPILGTKYVNSSLLMPFQ